MRRSRVLPKKSRCSFGDPTDRGRIEETHRMTNKCHRTMIVSSMMTLDQIFELKFKIVGQLIRRLAEVVGGPNHVDIGHLVVVLH